MPWPRIWSARSAELPACATDAKAAIAVAMITRYDVKSFTSASSGSRPLDCGLCTPDPEGLKERFAGPKGPLKEARKAARFRIVGRVEVEKQQQRKTVTLVFCDLAGSTELGDSTDPEVLEGRLRRYFERMEAIVERHGGTVEKFIGDAVMAVFGVPVAHEDDALRALRAAAEMRDAMPALRAPGTDRREHGRDPDQQGRHARHRRRRERRRAPGAGGRPGRGAGRGDDARAGRRGGARRRRSSRST